MLILHVTRDHAPAHCGGTSTAVSGLTNALLEQGIAGRVVSFEQWRPRANRSGNPLQEGVHAGLPVARLSTPDQLDSARAWSLETRADLILVHHEMLWEFAHELASVWQVPCVLVVHVFQAAMNRVRGIQERTMSLVAQEGALNQADAVIATSHAVFAQLLKLYPALEGRLHRLGLATERVAPERRKHFEPVVVFSGRFDSIKRLPLLLEAMERVVQVVPNVRLKLLGGNPGNPKGERRWHRRLASEVSTELQARLEVKGWLSSDELWEELAEASILVTPSLYETFGLSVLEAMAQGLAVLSSANGGLVELVQDGKTGMIVDSDTPELWSKALIDLLRNPDRVLSMGEAGRRYVADGLRWEHVAPQWRTAFLKLCGAGASQF